MLKSMTGYGKGITQSAAGIFTVEIRAVNHRYGEVSARLPRQFYAYEQEIKKLVGARVKRGKVDMYIQWEETRTTVSELQVDLDVARSYLDAARKIAAELGVSGEPVLADILAQKGVLGDAAAVTVLDETELVPLLREAVEAAVSALDGMRIREGESLATDLVNRRTLIAQWIGHIGERAPLVALEYRQKLKNRLDQLLDGTEFDENRLAQEVALMADRCDITEELVRLASHFAQFDETLASQEPVGRKLDFMMQEFNREINTIGSKSNDSVITGLVVQVKSEMEKMREQVQNVE